MKKNIYAGLFLVTLATLSYEILLTRIFSVTMWYHFAFVALSVAMFGMTVGAIIVYLFPNYFTQQKAEHQLALSALAFSLSIIFSFLTQLSIPFAPKEFSVGVIYSIILTYVVISVPFVLSGISVCLALTKFPKHVSKLYAADLAGAALGCILLIFVLRITDAATTVIVIASFASLGALFFAVDKNFKKLKLAALITTLLLAWFSLINTFLVAKQSSLIRIAWVRSSYEPRPLYEKWNSFSRVTVIDPGEKTDPLFWGMSPAYKGQEKIDQLRIFIDAAAGTIMTGFKGNVKKLEYLKYDIINFVHYVRPDSNVLVIGTGGGRDILSALAFNQKSVLGVEINDNIIRMLNNRFGDFSGHLDRIPNVRFVNDEARSFFARSKEKFDIIQVSLIDTAAATAAGAFVLTENSLYTVEAWKIFINHLTPSGILTFSRWYYRDLPGEMYRLTSLASASLMKVGVENPRKHMVILRCMTGEEAKGEIGVGTMLVSKNPFTDKDIDLVENVARQLQYEIILSPRFAADKTFEAIASGKDLAGVVANFPINIAPPVDDSPFFFHMLRLRNLFEWQKLGVGEHNAKAIFVLGALLFIVIGLSILCIIVPLAMTTKRSSLKGSLPFFIFFTAIGLGFMFIEISQMQRLIVFLGHPIYGLSVVLFSLLLSSGLGSYFTQKINEADALKTAFACLAALVGVLSLFGIATTNTLSLFDSASTGARIALSVSILFILGFFMGMPFPLGMRLASTQSSSLTPWLWGINGAASVCASVLAVVIGLTSGITTAFWVGVFCYLIAFFAFVGMARK